ARGRRGGQGPVYRGAHPARGRLRARDRRPPGTAGARPRLPVPRRPYSRHRQDRSARRDPPQARSAEPRGGGHHAPPSPDRREHRRAPAHRGDPAADHPQPPRALRRHRLPRPPRRHGHPATGANRRGLRRVRRVDQRPPVPGGEDRRGGGGHAAGGRRQPLGPRGGPGVRPRCAGAGPPRSGLRPKELKELLAYLMDAVALAFVALGVATAISWLRRRDRSLEFLALAIMLLAAVVGGGRLQAHLPFTVPLLGAISIVGFMGCAYALISYRD